MVQTEARKELFGIPKILFWGFLAVALFMVGDGIEQAFLSKYIVDIGFSTSQASLVFTVYGVMVVLGSWLAAVLSEIYGPRKIMLWGVILWVLFHAGFLVFGLDSGNYSMMLLMYGLRGIGYPLFLYAFLFWVTSITNKARLATAIGWFWCTYSIGIGVIGTYLPSFTIPEIGFTGTLWMSIVWIAAGGALAVFLTKNHVVVRQKGESTGKRFTNILKDIGIVYRNPEIIKIFIVRIINQLSLFGLVVVFPVLFTDTIGFTTQEWLWIWGSMNITLIFGDVFWGMIADRIGWRRQVMWFGCVGCGITTLLFYYLPMSNGSVFWLAVLVAVLFGITQSAFVPIFAIFTALEPNHLGATLSAHNLAAGLSNFAAPAIATIILPFFNVVDVIWVFAILYFIGAIITYFVKVYQPSLDKSRTNSSVSAEEKVSIAK